MTKQNFDSTPTLRREQMTETEERQELLNINAGWSYGAFVRSKIKEAQPSRFWKRCDVYASEMAARWVKEWGSTESAIKTVSGYSPTEIVRACSGLAELGGCIIIEEARRNCGWDDESTAPAIRSQITIVG